MCVWIIYSNYKFEFFVRLNLILKVKFRVYQEVHTFQNFKFMRQLKLGQTFIDDFVVGSCLLWDMHEPTI